MENQLHQMENQLHQMGNQHAERRVILDALKHLLKGKDWTYIVDWHFL